MISWITYIREVNEGIANAEKSQQRTLNSYEEYTYLQLLEKSIRRYMKSYLPKLDSSTISFNIAWSTLLGMLRSMT